jgi:hypothetical protein
MHGCSIVVKQHPQNISDSAVASMSGIESVRKYACKGAKLPYGSGDTLPSLMTRDFDSILSPNIFPLAFCTS